VAVGLPWKGKPKLFRLVVAPAVALCVLAAGGASAATLLSSSNSGTSAAKTASTASSAGGTAASTRTANDAAAADSASTPSGTLSIDGGGTSFAIGTTLTFDYTASTANADNWVGIYQASQTPAAGVGSAVWGYAPDTSGQVALSTSDLTPGTTYEAWLLYDNGYSEMSSGITFTVNATGTITIDGTSSVVDGLDITFDYTASSANAENWIGIYQPGQTPGDVASTVWTYTPDASGSATFSTADLTPGTWEAYLFYDNGYGVLGTPVTFTVTAPPKVPQPVYHASLDGHGQSALDDPTGVAVDSDGDVWTVDAATDRVAEFSAGGQAIRTFGGAGSGNGQLSQPQAIAVGGGDVFVADTGNNRVEEFTTSGAFVRTIGSAGTGNGQFAGPEGVAVASDGDVYVSDTGNSRVEEFSAQGTYTASITAGMSNPQGLAVAADGDLWVAQNGAYDTSDDSVTEYNSAGTQLQTVGLGNDSNYGGMSNPADVALDADGNVYVTEPDYDLVQEFNADSLYEGEFGTPGEAAGQPGASKANAGTLSMPESVAVGPDGQVYVADSGNHRIAEFEPQVAPAVTVQPVSVTVDSAYPAVFHAEASGTPAPTVQWESEAPGAKTFTPVAGATQDTLVVSRTATSQSGTRYEAVFTNATGTATTSAVTLTVQSAPSSGRGLPGWPFCPAGRPSVPARQLAQP
jgi:sugar lactone lactonase YvrE